MGFRSHFHLRLMRFAGRQAAIDARAQRVPVLAREVPIRSAAQGLDAGRRLSLQPRALLHRLDSSLGTPVQLAGPAALVNATW